jgi:DUF4097 and DUF4098 domain-containing protein YvlB
MRGFLVAVVVILVVAGGLWWFIWRNYDKPFQEADAAKEERLKQMELRELPLQQIAFETKSVGAKVARKLTIHNPFGSVEVVAGEGPVSLETKTFLPGKTPEEARKLGVPVEVRSETTPEGEVRIEVVPIKDTPVLDVMTLDLKLKTPAATAVGVEVTTGEVKVSGINGGVKAHGQSGKVTISECKGSVTASTTVGDLRIGNSSGAIEANTSSGALFVDDVSGAVTARTMNGMVNVAATRSKKIVVGTMSGAIDVKVKAPFSGQMEVSSKSGDVAVALPSRSNCRVRTMTNTGPITCTLPLSKVERAGPNVSGQLGAGQGYVEVSNDSGAITVRPLKKGGPLVCPQANAGKTAARRLPTPRRHSRSRGLRQGVQF